jgi:hypothetical protein
MVALDDLSKRNQPGWHGEAPISVLPVVSGVGMNVDHPPPSTRRRLSSAAIEVRARFRTPGRLVPIALIVAAVLTAAGLALAESIHSPEVDRQGSSGGSTPGATPAPAASSSSTTSPATTVPSTPRRTAIPGLVLASLSPGIGSAGQQITLSGSGFIGAGGYIAATFDGVVVPTRCPSEQTCLVTTPARGSGEVTVRLRTSAGESNPLVFRIEPSRVSSHPS